MAYLKDELKIPFSDIWPQTKRSPAPGLQTEPNSHNNNGPVCDWMDVADPNNVDYAAISETIDNYLTALF